MILPREIGSASRFGKDAMPLPVHPPRGYREPRGELPGLPRGLDELRSRFVYKPLDALLTGGLRVSGTTVAPRANGGSSNYSRARAVVAALVRHFPAPVEAVRGLLRRPGALPFAVDSVELLSVGTGSTVFLVRRPGDGAATLVLKVFRKTLGRRLDATMEYVCQRRRSYQMIVSRHASSGVALPTHFLVLHGPLLATAGAACLQPHVAGEKIDPFRDVSEAELFRMVEQSPRLAVQFRRLAAEVLDAVGSAGWCVDLVGHENLVLLRTERGPELRLLDYGVFDLAQKWRRSPHAVVEMGHRIITLRRILEENRG